MSETPMTHRRVSTFSSLSNRNYRWFWFGIISAFGGSQIQSLARGWLVYDMTKSPLVLGLVSAMWGIPMLTVSLFGGTLADRISKRKLILVAESINTLISIIVALLILSHRITVWQLMAASLLGGIVVSFNVPARQALVPELARRNELLNAIALNSAAYTLTWIIGPALAGILISVIGVGAVYLITVGSYLIAILSMWKIRISGGSKGEFKRSLWSGARDGIAYVKDNPIIMGLLTQQIIVCLFALPYVFLLPVFAADILKVGPDGLGWLNAMVGIGALMGALSVASVSNLRRKGLAMIVLAIFLGLILSLFAFSGLYYLSLLLLLGVGFGNQSYTTLNNTLLQTNSAPEMRGRVMSLNLAIWGMTPLGVLPIGAVAGVVGAPLAVGISAMLMVAATLILTVWRPQLRRL